MNDIITPTKSAATQTFTVSGSFWLVGEGFLGNQNATLEMQNRAGDGYNLVTNTAGIVKVSEYPNIVFCDLPSGTYRVSKTPTTQLASVSYIEG